MSYFADLLGAFRDVLPQASGLLCIGAVIWFCGKDERRLPQ